VSKKQEVAAPHELRHEIWVTRNGDIRTVIQDFPYDEPLPKQCALWMQGFVGRHFFPDANHRTAVALLREILTKNYIEIGNWPGERIRDARDRSHDKRWEMDRITLDDIYTKDELYEIWFEFFDAVLEV